jgi:hypothetical protein
VGCERVFSSCRCKFLDFFLLFSVAKHGLEEPSSEVAALISHATQERLKNVVEKLAVIAEHRIDLIKVRGMCNHPDLWFLPFVISLFSFCELTGRE